MLQPLVSIAMAAYNGERFIEQQLRSILSQTISEVEIVVSDDLSTDKTREIVKKLQPLGTIKLVENTSRLGVIKNFENALSHCTGRYVGFADQDDVWLPQKVEKSLALMYQLEAEHGTEMPLLVFTDARVVDEQLQTMSESYLGLKKLNPSHVKLTHLLVENVPTGCTMLMNRALVEKVQFIPKEVTMHDVFVSLTAACFGKMGYLNEPTLLYRQHNLNVLGLGTKSNWAVLMTTLSVMFGKSSRTFLSKEIAQAQAFYGLFGPLLTAKETALLEGFVHFREKGKLGRMAFLWSKKIRKGYWIRTLNMLLKA